MDAIAIKYSDWEPPCDKLTRNHIAEDRTDVLWRSISAGQALRHVEWVLNRPAFVADGDAAVRVVISPQPALGTIEKRFLEQADKWQRETEHLSSPTQIMMHPSYQAVLGMARGNEDEVVRLMIHDLQERRRPWFWALSYLTKDNPIKPSEAGRLDKMIGAWVDWGRRRGIL
jgi:hypothetical protein